MALARLQQLCFTLQLKRVVIYSEINRVYLGLSRFMWVNGIAPKNLNFPLRQ